MNLAEHGVKSAIHYYTQEEAANKTLARVRACTPADIGNAVLLLCMEEASFYHRANTALDGGASIMDPVFPLHIQQG